MSLFDLLHTVPVPTTAISCNSCFDCKFLPAFADAPLITIRWNLPTYDPSRIKTNVIIKNRGIGRSFDNNLNKCTLKPQTEETRPIKRICILRGNERVHENGTASHGLQIPAIYVSEEMSVATAEADYIKNASVSTSFTDVTMQTDQTETNPISWLDDNTVAIRDNEPDDEEEDEEANILPPVSPLHSPSSYHGEYLELDEADLKLCSNIDTETTALHLSAISHISEGSSTKGDWTPLKRFLEELEDPSGSCYPTLSEELPPSQPLSPPLSQVYGIPLEPVEPSTLKARIEAFDTDLDELFDRMAIDEEGAGRLHTLDEGNEDALRCGGNLEDSGCVDIINPRESDDYADDDYSMKHADRRVIVRSDCAELENWISASSVIGISSSPPSVPSLLIRTEIKSGDPCVPVPTGRKRKAFACL